MHTKIEYQYSCNSCGFFKGVTEWFAVENFKEISREFIYEKASFTKYLCKSCSLPTSPSYKIGCYWIKVENDSNFSLHMDILTKPKEYYGGVSPIPTTFNEMEPYILKNWKSNIIENINLQDGQFIIHLEDFKTETQKFIIEHNNCNLEKIFNGNKLNIGLMPSEISSEDLDTLFNDIDF